MTLSILIASFFLAYVLFSSSIEEDTLMKSINELAYILGVF
jgi:hypothetical protein